jgi:EAL domain-containing protein (putative c-di-GMP-specific phosphodiesterase class I)
MDPSTLLQHADIAMYVAKARNCGVFAYDPAVDGHSPAKLALLGDLRRGIDRDELFLHYQPKVSLSTGDVVGVEALVRWQHPTHGLIMPDDFIPLAEHTGLIAPLTSNVLNAALAQARRWLDSGQSIKVSVNLSARNLLDTRLPNEIGALLAGHGVPADLLEIEVTESALMTDPPRAQRLLEQLFALGIRIAIDDFGAGYTSLGQLRTLPISELKIDRSFVMAMDTDPGSAVIVQSVVDLGHNLGLTIIAEGVESERIMTTLSNIGCDVAQGYFISRPVTAAAIDTWRAARNVNATPNTLVPDSTFIASLEV